jgi:5-methylcytosine-specific restriction enzyme subunit McrC
MVALAKLALEMKIPSELSGDQALFTVDKNDVWLRQLYEKAIGGFYRFHLDPERWKVETSKTLRWPAHGQTSGFDSFMPTMKTDIEITDLQTKQKTVIDTKFTSFTANYRGKDRFKSGHLYQIYAYLRSQEELASEIDAPATRGMLLYPEIGRSANESAFIQNHHVSLVTVDLAADTDDLKANLLALFPY